MNRIKSLCGKALMAAAAVFASVQAAVAQTSFDFSTVASKAENGLKETLAPIINIVSILVAIIGVVMLVWNYVKRSKSDGQSNDALVSWGFSLIFVFVGLQVIKFIFL